MEENPYKAPTQDHAPASPLRGCLEAIRQFAVGLLLAAVLVMIGVGFCVGVYYTTSYFSEK